MKNTQTIIDHQINEICLRLDALDSDQLQDEDAQRAIRALALIGYEYRHPDSWENDLMAGLWTFAAMSIIMTIFAMFMGG